MQPASQPAAPHAACAINSNAINSTGLGQGLPWLQPASQLTDPSPLRNCWPTCRYFFEKCHFLVTTNPLDIKPSRCFAYGCMHLCTKFRHRTRWRFRGDRPRQNKQTVKYLVDLITICNTVVTTLPYRWSGNCSRILDAGYPLLPSTTTTSTAKQTAVQSPTVSVWRNVFRDETAESV